MDRGQADAASVSEVLSDFDLLEPKHELRLVQDALRLSAHVIDREVGQWRWQLLGRLPTRASPLVQAFAEDLRQAGDRLDGIVDRR